MSVAEETFNYAKKICDIDCRQQFAEKRPGVDINAADEDGYTALMLAVLRPELNKNNLVGLLLDLGADCDVENNTGETALFMAIEDGLTFTVYQMLWLADKNFISSNGDSSLAVAKYFSSNMREIIPLMEAWGFVDTENPTTYEQSRDLLYYSEGCTTCGGSVCGK
ncbi:hypothetical protein IB286_15070 [Spongiibacter sp. KMU-158]|uniref:Ankyrin repeat domain-containing protein n=1 Tax=Spongiibacter pelagi TaxID=2760804 RepID=A0A927C5V5_9GAMM|nr:hypothetical protein [Spongiibacter pelagi]MBD2860316.1 hypothetical protein [Spongiibacter pelagi]